VKAAAVVEAAAWKQQRWKPAAVEASSGLLSIENQANFIK
jgi:hypothetical protein